MFLMAAATGIGMVFVYDLFRIFRRVVRHNTVWVAIEDMFFWIGCAFWLFRLMYRQIDGSIRAFVILGALVGMLLYNISLSRWIVRGGTAVLRFIGKLFAKVGWFLSAPFRFLGRRLGSGAGVLGRLWKKNGRRMKKRLKKLWKTVKIGLCKL